VGDEDHLVITREKIKPDNGRVTAGIASLDSSARFERDTEIVTQEFRDAIEQEQRRNELMCLNPDGERPSTIIDASAGLRLSPAEFMRRLSALNPNFWFERSSAMPTEICACLKVPVTEDRPKGLWFQFGFSGERPLIEWNWSHQIVKIMHTRNPNERVEEKFACHGCDECRKEGAFFGRIRGWRSLLKILLDNKIITTEQIESMFGSAGNSQNWKTAIHGT